jgi:hypothetical protein
MSKLEVSGEDVFKVYRARSDRLEKLAQFLAWFAPAYGARTDEIGSTAVDEDTPEDVLRARDAAILAAFDAIRSIARDS